jgi:hypothetical protein
MPPAYDFELALTRAIEPTGGPGAELATLDDAARFVGLMKKDPGKDPAGASAVCGPRKMGKDTARSIRAMA